MSKWRQKAIECLPQCRREFEQPDTSIYQVLFELLEATKEAHLRNDREALQQYYGYAEWCFRQKDKALWNAAGVGFYEHLVDDKVTCREMSKWVRQDIYQEIRGLLESRISAPELALIDSSFSLKETAKAISKK